MNKSLLVVLMKVLSVLGTAFLGALGMFLSRVLEPAIAWCSFTLMKLTIKLTKSDTLRSLYGDLKKGYKENKGEYYYNQPFERNKDDDFPY